jgi:hypothetical protein
MLQHNTPRPHHPAPTHAPAFDGFVVATGFRQEKHHDITSLQNHHSEDSMHGSLESQSLFRRSERLPENTVTVPSKSPGLHILTSEQDMESKQSTQSELHAWQCNTSSSGSTIIGNSSSSTGSVCELQSEVSSEAGDPPAYLHAEDRLCEPEGGLVGSKLLVWRGSLGAQWNSESGDLTPPAGPPPGLPGLVFGR